MKRLTVLAALLWSCAVSAQSLPRFILQNNGVTQSPRRNILNLINSGCVDNATNLSWDCTFGTITTSSTPTWTGAHIWQLNNVLQAQTTDMTLQNITASTAGAGNQQWSPMYSILGTNWSGAASQVIGWQLQSEGVTGGSTTNLSFWQNVAGSLTKELQLTNSTPNLGAPGIVCAPGGQCSFESNANSIMINGTTSGQNAAYLYFSLGGNWIMRMGAGSYNNSLSPTVDIAGALGDTAGSHGWAYLYAQHLIGDATPGATTASTPPANVQFGVAPSTVTVTGSDMAMTLSFTTGTGPTAFAGGTKVAVTTVTYKTSYGVAPSAIVCSPANDKTAAAASGTTGVEFFADTSGTGTFVLEAIDSGAGSLTASTNYKIACIVVQ
jgi:hypothetical protein